MTNFLLTAWDWEPSVLFGCAALLLVYGATVGFKISRTTFCYVSGVVVLLLALVSPLDALSDNYSFSAHMLQHMLLILAVPPLLLLGIPREAVLRALRLPGVARTEAILSRPVFAWVLGVGILWFWHWPPLYNAALANERIHIIEHLSFLVGSTIFWWPVISPLEELRLEPLGAVVYTFAACSAHTVLAILLTFAPLGHYPAYINPPDAYGILPILRGDWGLTPLMDQQWGGLLMWVPACLVYLGFMLASLGRWYRQPEEALPA